MHAGTVARGHARCQSHDSTRAWHARRIIYMISSANAAASFVLNRGAGNYVVSGPAARTAYHDHVQVEVTVELD